jgi:hypothetical protein
MQCVCVMAEAAVVNRACAVAALLLLSAVEGALRLSWRSLRCQLAGTLCGSCSRQLRGVLRVTGSYESAAQVTACGSSGALHHLQPQGLTRELRGSCWMLSKANTGVCLELLSQPMQYTIASSC